MTAKTQEDTLRALRGLLGPVVVVVGGLLLTCWTTPPGCVGPCDSVPAVEMKARLP